MQNLETRNGTLVFVEVPENCHQYEYREKESMPLCLMVGYYSGSVPRQILCHYPIILPNCENRYELLGEVTKEGITFDCEPYESALTLQSEMSIEAIELREGFKFIVLKEK